MGSSSTQPTSQASRTRLTIAVLTMLDYLDSCKAQPTMRPHDTRGKGMSIGVGDRIFRAGLGLAITLMPPKRTYEIKKPKEE